MTFPDDHHYNHASCSHGERSPFILWFRKETATPVADDRRCIAIEQTLLRWMDIGVHPFVIPPSGFSQAEKKDRDTESVSVGTHRNLNVACIKKIWLAPASRQDHVRSDVVCSERGEQKNGFR
jgi:hypothetical protein